jgi:hypothetical protein
MDYMEGEDEAMNIINDIPTPLWRDIVCKIKRSAEVDIVRAALGTLQIEKNEVRELFFIGDIFLSFHAVTAGCIYYDPLLVTEELSFVAAILL